MARFLAVKQAWIRLRNHPIPPPDLVFLVAGTENVEWFLKSGRMSADCLTELLKAHGVDIDDLAAILDFGCGCGRVLRHFWRLPGRPMHGVDYNPKLIEWGRRNLPFARL